jgi:hypothetical protein
MLSIGLCPQARGLSGELDIQMTVKRFVNDRGCSKGGGKGVGANLLKSTKTSTVKLISSTPS